MMGRLAARSDKDVPHAKVPILWESQTSGWRGDLELIRRSSTAPSYSDKRNRSQSRWSKKKWFHWPLIYLENVLQWCVTSSQKIHAKQFFLPKRFNIWHNLERDSNKQSKGYDFKVSEKNRESRSVNKLTVYYYYKVFIFKIAWMTCCLLISVSNI